MAPKPRGFAADTLSAWIGAATVACMEQAERMDRRSLPSPSSSRSSSPPSPARAQENLDPDRLPEIRTLILLNARGTLEEVLGPLGFRVESGRIPGAVRSLEALNAGAIDFTATGESPPIFAQAAGTPLVYVGYEPPAPLGESRSSVLHNSPIQTVADLPRQDDLASTAAPTST